MLSKEVIDTCSLGIKEWLEFIGQHSPSSTRDMYDFFDSKGIYIKIDVWWYDELSYIPKFSAEILHENFDDVFDSRKEAEEFIFNKAFEILEERLENK